MKKYIPFETDRSEALRQRSIHVATRIARPVIVSGPQDIDEASGLPVLNEKIPVNCELDELNFLSPAYPMYFQYLKFCACLLLTMLVISGIYNIYSNSRGTTCIPPENIPQPVTREFLETHCILNFVTRYSLLNKVTDDKSMDTQDILNLVAIIALIILMQYLRKVQKETALICDERAITASDFTAKVMNLPKEFGSDENLAETIQTWFITNGVPGKVLNVQRVNICYDVSEKLNTVSEIEKLMVKKLELEKKKREGGSVPDEKFTRIDKLIEQKYERLRQINQEFQRGTGKFTGECYITFETQLELQYVLKHWHLNRSQIEAEEKDPYSAYKFRGSLLEVEQATEPTDILWENAGIRKQERSLRKLGTLFLTILILCASFYAVHYLQSNSQEIKTLNPNDAKEANSQLGFRAWSQLGSFSVIIFNILLDSWMRSFSDYERYPTYSENQANYAVKVAIAQFLNTTVVSLLIALKSGNIWGESGLTAIVYRIFRNDAIIPSLVSIFDYRFLLTNWRRNQLRDKKDTVIMQKDLLTEFEYPQFVFGNRYAYYIKTLLSAAFYAPLVPGILVWLCLGFSFKYWVDKYILLNHRSRGRSMGPELPILLMELMEWSIILFALGNLLFSLYVEEFDLGELIPTIIGAVLGILNTILPMREINDKLFPKRGENVTDDRYSEMRIKFMEDYDRANPATGEMALEKYAQERQGAPAQA